MIVTIAKLINVKYKIVLILLCFLFSGIIVFFFLQQKELYHVYNRPDGEFSILVFRKKFLLATMPGQASDAPGEITLINNRSHKVLQSTHVEMVQLVEEPEWSDNHVTIRLIADWPLSE